MGEAGADWRTEAGHELLRLRGSAPGWGYRVAAPPAVEPTALACLGLLASPPGEPSRGAGGAGDSALVASSSDWLAAIQRPDGSLGLSQQCPTPGWTTPLAVLLWQALACRTAERSRALDWLLQQQGEQMSPADDPDHIVGHDTMLVGWPWVAGTHSWLEPTALAVLALCRAGLAGHPRVVEADRLIRDRAIVTGGWNYGNKAAFGHPLRPQPAATGLALLALGHRDDRTAVIARAIQYLHQILPGVRASASLGWGLLGLRAWASVPESAETWLAEAHERATGRRDAAPKLALLLLAGAEHGCELFE